MVGEGKKLVESYLYVIVSEVLRKQKQMEKLEVSKKFEWLKVLEDKCFLRSFCGFQEIQCFSVRELGGFQDYRIVYLEDVYRFGIQK